MPGERRRATPAIGITRIILIPVSTLHVISYGASFRAALCSTKRECRTDRFCKLSIIVKLPRSNRDRYLTEGILFTDSAMQYHSRTCKIQTLYVSFRDLQWQVSHWTEIRRRLRFPVPPASFGRLSDHDVRSKKLCANLFLHGND